MKLKHVSEEGRPDLRTMAAKKMGRKHRTDQWFKGKMKQEKFMLRTLFPTGTLSEAMFDSVMKTKLLKSED